MKYSAYRILFICILVLVVLVAPVYADPLITTITKVYIQQDNHPVGGPVNYSMNCYGSYTKSYPIPENRQRNRSPDDPVFSYSLNCLSQGCPLYDFYNTWMLDITSCDIEGTYQGRYFIIKNFSRGPEPSSCTWVNEQDCEWEDGQECDSNLIYDGIQSEDSSKCHDAYRLASDQCDQMKKTEKNMGSWQNEYRECGSKAYTDLQECEKFHSHLINLNRSDVLKYPYDKHAPSMFCEFRFSIPSDNTTSELMVRPKEMLDAPKSPVASLYCTILGFFGGQC
jgi:hypothetical protein